MAVLGYCPSCEKLVPIKPGAWRFGLRERHWETMPHEDKDGRPCGNRKTI